MRATPTTLLTPRIARIQAAFIILALGVLTGCASSQTDLVSGMADTQIAVLKGSWRERFFVARKTDITAIDGKRMQSSISYWSASAVRLPPGRHWIEFSQEEHYAVLGGSNYCTCVFDYDFEAGRVYQLTTDSVTYEVPCATQLWPRLYSGSLAMEISAPQSAPQMVAVSTLCTAGLRRSHFCRKDEDCEGQFISQCQAEQDSMSGIGLCVPRDG